MSVDVDGRTICGACRGLIMPGNPAYCDKEGNRYHDAPGKRCRPKDMAGPVAQGVDSEAEKGTSAQRDDVEDKATNEAEIEETPKKLDAEEIGEKSDAPVVGEPGKIQIQSDNGNVTVSGIEHLALRYLDLGFSVIPVKPRDKKPDVSKWEQYQKRQPKKAEVEGWFPEGADRNIGVICGNVSGGLFVPDFDKGRDSFVYVMGETAERVAESAPVAKTGGGQQEEEHFHVYLRSKDGKAPKSRKFRRKDGKGIDVDLQGEGKYVVAPPSVHPSGDKYEFVGPCRTPLKVDSKKFVERLEMRAEEWPYVKMILGHWKEGQRNSLALGFSAFIRKYLGWDEERAKDVIELVCRVKSDPEEKGRLLVVEGTYTKNLEDIAVMGTEPFFNNELFGGMKGLLPQKRTKGTGKGGKKPTKEEVAYAVAQELMNQYSFVTIRDTEEIFQYRQGVWVPLGERTIKTTSEAMLGEDATKKLVGEIVGHIERTEHVEREVFNHPDGVGVLVNVKNGVLDISENPPKLLDHSPDFKFTYKLPIVYEPDATCPQVEKFFNDVLFESDVDVMAQWFGYHLHPGYPYHHFFLLHGEGRNGKSKMKGLIEAFVGKDNVCNASLQAINEDKFIVANLYGKLANICGDLPKKPIKYTGVLKQLCGGDRLIAQKKHKNPFHFTNSAKLTFICNELPATEDDTTAFWERLILIEFPNSFLDTDPNRDEDILDKLTTPEELSGLLNLALKGLRGLLAEGHFGETMATEEKRELYIRASAPEQAFMGDCLIIEVEGKVFKEEFYRAYCGYCSKYGLVPSSQGNLTKELKRFVGMKRGHVEEKKSSAPGRTRYWKGVALRCESESCDIQCFDRDDSQATLE